MRERLSCVYNIRAIVEELFGMILHSVQIIGYAIFLLVMRFFNKESHLRIKIWMNKIVNYSSQSHKIQYKKK